jgi:hypothetical protein
MSRIGLWSISLGMLVALGGGEAYALPGQTVEEVTAWIKTNSTLQPGPGETLMVRKSDTPAHRFTFEARLMPPGRATATGGRAIIRSEKISLFDTVNGVSRDRLENSLRVIYGPDLYQDYQQAKVMYQYPNSQMVNESRNQAMPLLEATQGEIRQGARFAYWIETVQPQNGKAQNGRISVFLPEDIGKLQAELQGR